MFCPECRSEFIEGIETCPVCDVDLVDELQPEPKPEFVDFDEVLATYNPADIALLKSILGMLKILSSLSARMIDYICSLKPKAAFILNLLNDSLFLRFIGDKGVRTPDDARKYILNGPVASYDRHGFGLYLIKLIQIQW